MSKNHLMLPLAKVLSDVVLPGLGIPRFAVGGSRRSYASWPVWRDSTTKEVKFWPWLKRPPAGAIFRKAKSFERQMRQPGKQDGFRLNRVRRIVLGLLVAPTLSGFMVGQAFAQLSFPQIPFPQIPFPQIPSPQIPSPQIPSPQSPSPQSPSPQSPALAQALTDHGVSSSHANGTQKCVWQFSQAIGTGDTVVGYVHSADQNDETPMYPQAVTDNAGNTYNLSSPVQWVPWPEDIGIWYLTNIQGNPDTFTFDYTQYPASDGTVLDFCDVGFAEYSGASSVTVADPVLVSGATPSITISPPAPSLIWAFASPYLGSTSSMLNSGYSVIINDFSDDIAVWESNSIVPAGPLSLNWNAPAGDQNPCDGTTNNGCPTVVAAVAVQGSR